MTKITGILHEDQNAFLIISRSVLLRIGKVSNKSCRENRNTHFTINKFFFSKIVQFMRYAEKFRTVGQATDKDMAQAH